jgi:hypothetical protein
MLFRRRRHQRLLMSSHVGLLIYGSSADACGKAPSTSTSPAGPRPDEMQIRPDHHKARHSTAHHSTAVSQYLCTSLYDTTLIVWLIRTASWSSQPRPTAEEDRRSSDPKPSEKERADKKLGLSCTLRERERGDAGEELASRRFRSASYLAYLPWVGSALAHTCRIPRRTRGHYYTAS